MGKIVGAILMSLSASSFASEHDPRLPDSSLEIGVADFSGKKSDIWTATEVKRTEPFIRVESRFWGRLYFVFQFKTSAPEHLWVRQTYGEEESSDPARDPLRLDVNSHLRSKLNHTYGFGLRGVIWKNYRLLLQSDLLFENSPRADVDIEKAELASDFQTIDLTRIVTNGEAVRAEYEWKRFDAGIRVDVTINDRLTLYSRAGFTALLGSVRLYYSDDFAAEIDQWAEKLTEVLGWAPIVLKHRFDMNYLAPTFTLGTELRLWDWVSLNALGSITHADEGSLWVGQLGLIFRGNK